MSDNKEQMVFEKSWEEFSDSGLLWWINMILHTFGWAICVESNTKGEINRVYPSRVKYRGFPSSNNDKGYYKISKYLKNNINEIFDECDEVED